MTGFIMVQDVFLYLRRLLLHYNIYRPHQSHQIYQNQDDSPAPMHSETEPFISVVRPSKDGSTFRFLYTIRYIEVW